VLLGHARVKHHLKQQIAELLAQMLAVAVFDGVGDLVRFLDGVGRDGAEGLLAVPRAAALGIAQPRHEREQCSHGALGFAHGT
jgi:chemotaxis response regulator CheB